MKTSGDTVELGGTTKATPKALKIQTPIVLPKNLPTQLQPGTANPFATNLSAACPILLFPFRIETRFGSSAAGPELWVRIYPDQIEMDSHDPTLTQNEVAAGTLFWNAMFYAGSGSVSGPSSLSTQLAAGTSLWNATPWLVPAPGSSGLSVQQQASQSTQRDAWRALASAFGPTRAAWIACALTPTNISSWPVAPSTAENYQTMTPQPVFPNVTTRSGGWSQGPVVRMLPTKWMVVAYSNERVAHVALGAEIAPNMSVFGFDQTGTGSSTTSVTQSMLAGWMSDFDQAVSQGMGVRMPITAAEQSAGFDRIVVVGLNSTAPSDAATAVSSLIDSHHYSDGVAFVPPGTPTKNMPNAPSGVSSRDQDSATSFAVEMQGSLMNSLTCNGAVTARDLGLTSKLGLYPFPHVQHADGTDQVDASQMATALWPSTLGYFLQSIVPGSMTNAQLQAAQSYFINHVRGGGTIPAIRVGSTPYGILPVTSLNLWNPPVKTDAPQALVNLLLAARTTWAQSSATSPTITSLDPYGNYNPDQDLLSVLGMDASAVSYIGRLAIGPQTAEFLLQFMGASEAAVGAWTQAQAEAAGGITSLFTQLPNLSWSYLALDPSALPVPCPNVWDPPLSETNPLPTAYNLGLSTPQIPGVIPSPVNYIQLLASSSAGAIQSENYPLSSTPNYTLYKILRQSVLLQQSYTASTILVAKGVIQPTAKIDPEILNMGGATSTPAPSSLLSTKVPGLATSDGTFMTYVPSTSTAGSSSLSTTLFPGGGLTGVGVQALAALNGLQSSLNALAVMPTAKLNRLMGETLDTCSHRLDAWITSVADSLLDSQRNAQGDGVLLGCYGWVENVRPASTPLPPNFQQLPQNPVVTMDELQAALPTASQQPLPARIIPPPATSEIGFVHTPSLDQAATAAVLMNAYQTHQSSNDGQMFLMDLSSDRVSMALWLLEGIRQGQSLGALLGCRFEQWMHANQQDQYISAFRSAYPLVANKLTPTYSGSSVVTSPTVQQINASAAPSVVDGVALLADYNGGAGTQTIWTKTQVPSASQQTIGSVVGQVDQMADGLGDLSIAEAVFQLLKGNKERAAAMLNAVSRGENAPEPAIVDTPRSGAYFTNRLMVLLPSGSQQLAAAWASVGNHPRRSAEPAVDAWLSNLFPSPSNIQCTISFTVPPAANGGSPTTGTVTATLADLDAGPLDLIEMANVFDTPQQSELEQRLIYAFYNSPRIQALLPAGASAPALTFAPSSSWTAGALAFPNALTLARSFRDLIKSKRPLEPNDFLLPSTQLTPQQIDQYYDMTDLVGTTSSPGRAISLLESLDSDLNTLESACNTVLSASPSDTTSTGALRNALINASWYGLKGSIPVTQSGPDAGPNSQILAQAKLVMQQLTSRKVAAADVLAPLMLPPAMNPFTASQLSEISNPATTADQDPLVTALSTLSAASPPASSLDPSVVVSLVQTILGKSFAVLPRVKIPDDPSNGGNSVFESAPLSVGAASLAQWRQQLTHLRPAVSILDKALLLPQILSGASVPSLSIWQVPTVSNDSWLALNFPTGQTLARGRVAIECFAFPAGVSLGAVQETSGIMVDEWIERIPSPTVNTAVAYEYAQPWSRAPQCLLLAVNPTQNTDWDLATLLTIINETITLAHIRTVDLEVLGFPLQVLPALYFAYNATGATFSAAYFSSPANTGPPVGVGGPLE